MKSYSFEEYTTPYTFVAAKPSKNSSMLIETVVEQLMIKSPLNRKEYHATLIYDEDSTVSKKLHSDSNVVTAEVTGVDILGKKGDRWEAVVLMLESDGLRARQKELLDYGFETSYPDYIPHLSIKYMPQDIDRKRLDEYNAMFTGLRVSFVSEEWIKD